MLYVFFLFIEIYLFIDYRLRIRPLTAVDMICPFILLSQTVFWFAEILGLSKFEGPESLFSFASDPGLIIAIYGAIYIITYTATVGIKIRMIDAQRANIVAILKNLHSMTSYVAAVLYLTALTQVVFLNKELLWYNTEYLIIYSPDGLTTNSQFIKFISAISNVAGIFATILFASSLFIASTRNVIIMFPLVLWYIIFAMAGASRHSAVLIFVVGAVGVMLARKRKAVIGGSFFLISVYLLIYALNARGLGEYGISVIFSNIAQTSLGGEPVMFAIRNLFQGVFITGDGIIVDADHKISYKMLSFSPFPSFIDGFDAIRVRDEIRLHEFVPMSAISEVVHFGYFYIVMFAGVYLISIRISIVRIAKGKIVSGMMATIVIFATFVIANAYPLRNVFRQLLWLILIMVIVDAWDLRRRRVLAVSRFSVDQKAS